MLENVISGASQLLLSCDNVVLEVGLVATFTSCIQMQGLGLARDYCFMVQLLHCSLLFQLTLVTQVTGQRPMTLWHVKPGHKSCRLYSM